MGYRSEVAITMDTKNYNVMIRRAKALKNKHIYNLIDYADIYTMDNGKVTTLYWGYVKWYQDYKEVQWIENFIKKIDATFVRIGEDRDDNEELYYNNGDGFFEYTYYRRSIEIEGIKQEKQSEENELFDELLDEIDRRL